MSMDETNDVTPESSPEEGAVEEKTSETVSEDENTPASSAPAETEEVAEEKVVPYSRFKEVNDELARLKRQPPKTVNKNLGVEDYIDISTSLDGLDAREKEYLARQHKLSGTPLAEIRKDEDFLLWQSAHRAKVEKEKSALAPSTTQTEQDRPKGLTEKLRSTTSLAEKEKLLTEAGLYRPPKPRPDQRQIGAAR